MMLRRTFFAVFLFILFCVTLSYATEGARGDDFTQEELTLLDNVPKKKFILEESDEKVEINSFRSPALIEVEGKVAVVAEARYTNTGKDYVGVASVTIKKNGKPEQISTVLEDADYFPFMLSPTVIADKYNTGEIFVYFGGYCENCQPLKEKPSSPNRTWQHRIVQGTFGDSLQLGRVTQSAEVFFEPHNALELIKKMDMEEFIVSGGAGVLMENGTYALPVQALYKNGSTVSLIITSSDAVYEWEFSAGRSDINCTNPAVLELKANELLMVTSCESGYYKVYKSTDKGESWAAVETLSGVWGTNKEREGSGFRNGFIKAKIGKTDVIFFTQPVEIIKGSNNYSLRLWATDMTHIYDAGQISAVNENVSASSLLYKKGNKNQQEQDKLYCSYEITRGDKKHDVVVVELKNELREIRDVVKKWRTVNKEVVERFCSSTKNNDNPSARNCKTIITSGLVGYLSQEPRNGREWEDEYLCVNATASPENNSVDSTSSAAERMFAWPATSDGQNQPYHFANSAFTLLATVTIDKTPFNTVPLLGVVFKDSEEIKHYGLSCTNDRWLVVNGKEQKHKDKWTTGKQHQVVLTRKGTKLHVYIDGKPFEENIILNTRDANSFSHFYIGAYDTGKNTGVTVKDVFLYNRQLHKKEIKDLQKTKDDFYSKAQSRSRH